MHIAGLHASDTERAPSRLSFFACLLSTLASFFNGEPISYCVDKAAALVRTMPFVITRFRLPAIKKRPLQSPRLSSPKITRTRNKMQHDSILKLQVTRHETIKFRYNRLCPRLPAYNDYSVKVLEFILRNSTIALRSFSRTQVPGPKRCAN